MFIILYRTGGNANFKWHRAVAGTRDEAASMASSLRRAGYKCMHTTDKSIKLLGFPSTFDAEQYFPELVENY